MSRPALPSVLAIAAPLAFFACSGPQDAPPAAADASAVDHAVLEAALQADVRNARLPQAGLVTAGQPDQEQVEALWEAGASAFISLRPTTEGGAGWEEAYASAEGVGFSRLPISGAESLTRENVEHFAELLADYEGEPLVVYCASSNRVGAMLALKAHWHDGVAPEEALAIGRDAGMTSLEGSVRELLGLD